MRTRIERKGWISQIFPVGIAGALSLSKGGTAMGWKYTRVSQ